jgi:hypothetical protein
MTTGVGTGKGTLAQDTTGGKCPVGYAGRRPRQKQQPTLTFGMGQLVAQVEYLRIADPCPSSSLLGSRRSVGLVPLFFDLTERSLHHVYLSSNRIAMQVCRTTIRVSNVYCNTSPISP